MTDLWIKRLIDLKKLIKLQPLILTHHFHNKPMPLTAVLCALAGQEGNDGDEGNVMQAAADYIKALLTRIEKLEAALREITQPEKHYFEAGRLSIIAKAALEDE